MTEIEWRVSDDPVPYGEAIAAMEARVAAIRTGEAPEMVWLLEHPALFTAGTGARPEDLLDPLGLPVFATGRGGQYTYHGPGQRVAYAMLDLKARKPDIRAFVTGLEDWLIATLADLGVSGETHRDRIGVRVRTAAGEAKIAAIGVRIRRWVSYHGVALNVAPDLSHYRGIVPCGIREHGVTSLAALGIQTTMAQVDRALRENFDRVFGN